MKGEDIYNKIQKSTFYEEDNLDENEKQLFFNSLLELNKSFTLDNVAYHMDARFINYVFINEEK